MSWRNAHKLARTLHNTQTTHSQRPQITEGGIHTSQRPHTQPELQGHRRSPKCVNYNLVNEQAQSQPHRIHARHQGTQSPQISVTFQNFNPWPLIWCRGPRPKAHWYMHTDGTNYRIVTWNLLLTLLSGQNSPLLASVRKWS